MNLYNYIILCKLCLIVHVKENGDSKISYFLLSPVRLDNIVTTVERWICPPYTCVLWSHLFIKSCDVQLWLNHMLIYDNNSKKY